MLGELFRGSVGGGPALGEFCCARPERRHGGQPAQATTHRVTVRVGGLAQPPVGPTCR